MSEFLQNLRAKQQNKRYEGNRRQYPNSQYQDRRNEKDNRKNQGVATAVETLSAALVENLPLIKAIMEGISENQKKLADAQDRRARAEERKAAVLESIFDYAKQYIGAGINVSGINPIIAATENPKDMELSSKETVVEPEPPVEFETIEPEPPVEFETIEPSLPGREEILAMIGDMREKGSTYDQIATHLEMKGIPTFSRKGQWRGQTVHRLYQKMTS